MSHAIDDNEMSTTGQQAEDLACDYLRTHGLRLLRRNFHCRFGEIDLIMQQQKQLIFVEVKYRRYTHFANPVTTITWQKQKKLRLTASFYLQQHPHHANMPCRFDAMVIEGTLDNPHYQWLTNILPA